MADADRSAAPVAANGVVDRQVVDAYDAEDVLDIQRVERGHYRFSPSHAGTGHR
jgi:hypothetical protein